MYVTILMIPFFPSVLFAFFFVFFCFVLCVCGCCSPILLYFGECYLYSVRILVSFLYCGCFRVDLFVL